jgi:osmotically-inducible protein OsmY
MRSYCNQPFGKPGRPSDHRRFMGEKFIFSILLVLMLTLGGLTLSACSNSPRRTTGTVLNDQTLERRIEKNIRSNPGFGENDHIKVEVHLGVVLLAGETVSEENRALATKLAEEERLTERVVNDLIVGEHAGFGGKLDNSWLTSKVNSKLTTENALPGNDSARIKVVSSQNTVYLMGMVTREEGNIVAEIVRNIRGVDKVVTIFDYSD